MDLSNGSGDALDFVTDLPGASLFGKSSPSKLPRQDYPHDSGGKPTEKPAVLGDAQQKLSQKISSPRRTRTRGQTRVIGDSRVSTINNDTRSTLKADRMSVAGAFPCVPRKTLRVSRGCTDKRDPLRLLRQKVASAYSEYLEVAKCRLKAAEANKISPPTRQRAEGTGEQMPRHAWLHSHLAPLSWIPYSLNLTRDTKPVVVGEHTTNSKRAMRSLTTLEFGAGLAHLRAKHEDKQPEDDPQQVIQCTDPLLESSAKLREGFRVAVSEAKLAQAQSLAAWRDVQSLRAAVERNRRSYGNRRSCVGNFSSRQSRHAPRGGGGAAAAAAAVVVGEPQLRAKLQGQHEQLKKLEASLKQEIQDVQGQIKRLQGEVQRRQQRAEGVTKSCSSTGDGSSARPDDGHVPHVPPRSPPRASGANDETLRTIPKYLASCRVLPDISRTRSCNSTPREPPGPNNVIAAATCHSARGRTEAQARPPAPPQPALPSLPWRACTAP